jgi:hypothetical protein
LFEVVEEGEAFGEGALLVLAERGFGLVLLSPGLGDGGCGIGAVWDGNVVEETEGDGTLAFELGSRPAHGKGDELYGPEGRKHPAEGVAFGMALAEDSSLAVYLVAADGDDLGENGNFGLG